MPTKNLLSPFQKFAKVESLSGLLLLFTTLLALLWANSPFAESYHQLWQFKLGVTSEKFTLSKPLLLWINDGLMAIFFFVIGLEIKRELLLGELNAPQKIVFPFFAAIGGMVMPVAIFLVLNPSSETLQGWAIPMATDIAFALAILKFVGDKVPLSLKVFLTAFAIIDDIGAVLVVALFYSSGIKWSFIVVAAGLLLILYIMAYYKYFSIYILVFLSIIVWVLFLKSGIHPTIAGVLLAFAVPIHQKIKVADYGKRLNSIAEKIHQTKDAGSTMLSKEQIRHIDDLVDWTSQVQSPLQQLEHKLHNWVAYLIMPIFALANAGISFNFGATDFSLAGAIATALIAGNVLGVGLLSYMVLQLGWSSLPEEVTFKQIIGVAFLAGVGFTMSIFIANLAFFNDAVLLDSAKLGIFIGSIISGLIGYSLVKYTVKHN